MEKRPFFRVAIAGLGNYYQDVLVLPVSIYHRPTSSASFPLIPHRRPWPDWGLKGYSFGLNAI